MDSDADNHEGQIAGQARMLGDVSPDSADISMENRTSEPLQGEAGHSGQPAQPQPQQSLTDSQSIHYAAQTVPKEAKTAFSQVTAEALNKWVMAADTGGAEFQSSTHDLFMLCTRLLHDTNGSRQRNGRSRQT